MSVESKVGAFVIASLLVLGAAIYFVRTTQTVRGQVPFRTYFHDAGGLASGANVLFGGIKVGQITTVHPWSDDPTRIEIAFEVTSGTPINDKSTARVGTVSLMASPVLMITTGSSDGVRLGAGAVVPSKEAVSTDEMVTRVATVAESANALIGDLRRDLPPLTSEARSVLANLNQITGTQNQRQITLALADIRTLLEHADGVVVSAKPLIADLDRTVMNVNSTVDAIREPLTADLAQLGRTLEEARALLASANNVVRTNEDDIAAIVRGLRATAENLRVLSESLKQRPWTLIRATQPQDRKVPQ